MVRRRSPTSTIRPGWRPAIAHGIGLFDGPERSAASALVPVPRRAVDARRPRQLRAPARGGGPGRGDRAGLASEPRSSSRAGRRCTSSGSTSCRSRPLVRRRRSRCSGNVPGPSGRAGSPMASSTRSARSATCSTTCRSGSNWPRRGSSMLPPTVIRDRLAARLPLPGPGPATSRRASGRSTTRWPGATTCWSPSSSRSSSSSACSTVASTSTR